MSDPFTPATPPLSSEENESDARDFGRSQDPTGATSEDRSFTGSDEADADADAARRLGEAGGQQQGREHESQQELDANTDTSRDDRQNPLGQNAGADTADNLGQ
jgi:hypothetical protein